MWKRLLRFFTPAVIMSVPPGIVADRSGVFNLFGLMQNLNSYAQGLVTITTAGTNSTLTAVQTLIGVTRLTAGASGGFTITLPSTVALLAQLGPTIPIDGSFSKVISFMNDNVAQTGTVTVGDASTTITGTATVATNIRRFYMLNVPVGGTTITLQNLGTATV